MSQIKRTKRVTTTITDIVDKKEQETKPKKETIIEKEKPKEMKEEMKQEIKQELKETKEMKEMKEETKKPKKIGKEFIKTDEQGNEYDSREKMINMNLKEYKGIDRNTFIEAWKTIKEAVEIKRKEDNPATELFPRDISCYLRYFVYEIEQKQTITQSVKLPHPFVKRENVCLFSQNNKEKTKEVLQRHNISVDKIYTTKQIREIYSTPESQRELAKNFGTFLIDMKVAHLIPDLFFNQFTHTNIIRPVSFNPDLIAESFDAAINGAAYFPKRSDYQKIKIGSLSQSNEDLADNCMALMKSIEENVWYGKKNIMNV